ncbi:mas-related G-protein coupled receptor member A6-like [Anolis carolinensis]|uniref:mas-related G-protein coupled receptor member A6-like n=1 Tax=Anolis carolinensis TaxID=28377 RepID=UPI000203907D
MAFIFLIHLWVLLQLTEAYMISPLFTHCSKTTEQTLLSSPKEAVVGQYQHLRKSDLNMTELKNISHLTLNLNNSQDICQEYKYMMAFITWLPGDHVLAPFVFFIFTVGLNGSAMILVFLLSNFQKHSWNIYIWNIAVAHLSVLTCVCIVCLFVNRISQDVNSGFVKWFLHLAYLFSSMNYFSLHFIVAILIHWCLVILIPNWYRGQQPDFVAPLISVNVSILLLLACCILFCFHLDIDTYAITFMTCMIFFPLMVLSVQTLIIRYWHIIKKYDFLVYLFGLVLFLFTWNFICLLFWMENDFPVITLSSFLFTSLSSTMNLVLYILVGELHLPNFWFIKTENRGGR